MPKRSAFCSPGWLARLALVGGLGSAHLAAAVDPTAPPDPPVFGHAHGLYEKPFSLAITSSDPASAIWYTTNGDAPSPATSRRYRDPIIVTATTVVRAACFRDHGEGSAVVTQTYLFLRDVIAQTGAGFPRTWGTNQGQPVRADYEMDPEITRHPAYRDEIFPALRALPILSLVAAGPDLFDPGRGLYANPRSTGPEWERAASLELIQPDGGAGFQVNCGLRIQGGWNRRPEESPKHSFRVVFRKKYGPGKLRYPLFGDDGAREFDEFILRAGCNNTWLHWSGEERRRGEFIRDQWMRDTFAAMGHSSARGLFAHLYVNGLYWGLYNPTERPSAPFVAWHLGGKPEHYDVRNADKVLEGDDTAWRQMMDRVNAGVTRPADYQAVAELVDLPRLIDFLILNFYGANADWDRASNWYAARRRQPPGPFQFFVWDGERTLEGVDDQAMAGDDDQSPTRLFQRLRANPGFRREFGARARRHLTGNGALAPLAAADRYRRWAERLDRAVVAESARWGDYRRDEHRYKTGPFELYTRDDHWRPEVRRLLEDYFPRRAGVMLEQFRKAGMDGVKSEE